MATVVMHKDFQADLKLDGSLKKNAWDLLRKLSSSADSSGLNLKIPQGAIDRRVRVARVNDNFRAVLFAAGTLDEATYVLVAIKPHDLAYQYASTLKMQVNPMNGVFEVLKSADAAPVAEPPAAAPSTVESEPLRLPFQPGELIALGITERIAHRAVEVRDDDELQRICVDAPSWQGSALLDLAFGASLEDVRRTYTALGSETDRGTAHEFGRGEPDAEQLRESLRRPGSQMDFVVFSDDEHMRRILEGDFEAWRVFLHPEQRSVAYHPGWKGSFRITGGAGTGKTIVGMHRAVFLARRSDVRVLVTTFTRNLAEELKRQLAQLAEPEVLARIDVRGVDQLASEVLLRAKDRRTTLRGNDERHYWQRVLDRVDLNEADRQLLTPDFLSREYVQVILGHGVRNRDEYLKVSRPGRRVRLNRLQRARIWSAVEEFERQLSLDDKTTFGKTVVEAAEIVADQRTLDTHRYDHVVVDEAQDLSPAHWRLLRGVVPVGPDDLFICEDAHQRIYGDRVVLSRYGIETRGRSRKLTLNYRTTSEVLKFATGILGDEKFLDLDEEPDSVERYRSLLRGWFPVRRGFRNDTEEQRFIVQQIAEWRAEPGEPGEIAVLARTRTVRDRFARALRESDIPAVIVEDGDASTRRDAVQVATMNRAKGVEYRRVAVVAVDERTVPNDFVLGQSAPEEQDDVRQRERCLFYVACTRPRDQLLVTWVGTPSPFLPEARAEE
ncbi:UvrD-helicase domain-containing protein [Saccharopolyspora phatthalungensis]|uniref:DNA 3'-5' helicase n=1 Tax=Saccharopolyspora phatthalungensis TaxID=664693 RepID=A0A840Q3K0_9PSEU|nr:UvrD-helicase domain-containing protein [Saccharopolyspora phatthalungensis]MBB5154191.1 superfamily I DNA/RNA helicase [Saccharopolyspora phatthalungensis]